MFGLDFFKKTKPVETQAIELTGEQIKAAIFSDTFSYGVTSWSDYDYKTKVKFSYQLNAVTHAVINEIAGALSNVPYQVWNGDNLVEDHPMVELLNKPNAKTSKEEFLFALVAFLHLSGDSYVEALRPGQNRDGNNIISQNGAVPFELWNHLPHEIELVMNKGRLVQYNRKLGTEVVRTFPVDDQYRSNLLQVKKFNPANNINGMSDLESVGYPVDIINDTFKSTKRFINKDGNIGNFLMKESGTLTEEEAKEIQKRFQEAYGGVDNSGKMPVMGGFRLENNKSTPREMEYIQGINLASRHIALAFGVPPMILGIEGDNTYSNQKEARLAFYENKVQPLANHIAGSISRWLNPMFGTDFRISWDWDQVPAMQFKRSMQYKSLQDAGFLTINEKRLAVGYDPIEGGEGFTVAAPQQEESDPIDETE